MRRRFAASLIALAALAAGSLTSHASSAAWPTLLEDGTWARAPYSPVVPQATGELRAGAATGDITTPPGAPMTGFYVYRVCPTGTALEAAGKAQDWTRQVEEDPTEAPYAPSQCVAPRLGPDTDGYAKTFPASDGRFGRLRAQAFVLDDGATKVAIVSVDLPGFFGEMHDAVANKIEPLTGISRENLLVSASHTHTGPGGYFQQNLGWATLGGDQYDPRLFEAITVGIADAIIEADARLEPAKLAAGEAFFNLNGNRRGGQWQMNPEPEKAVDPPNAPRLGMIRVDAADGTPLGAITNYSTHGVIGNILNMWHTGDDKAWVGRLFEQEIRAEAGLPDEHPIVGATLNGAQGDIGTGSCIRNWRPHMDGSDFADFMCMESAGMRQAAEYIELWRDLGDELTDEVTLDSRFDMVCFCGQYVERDPYDPFDEDPYVPENDDPAYFNVAHIAIQGEGRGEVTLSPGHHRRQPLLVGPPGVSPKNVRVQVMRVGNVAFASMPGEPTIQMGRRVERSVKTALAGLADHVWVAGLGNDHNAYFATMQEYEAYQYEGGWSFYGQQSGNLLKLRLGQLAEWMALGEPVPECTLDRGCMENPDLSALSAEPQPLVPDLPPEIVAQPNDVERFEGTRFVWYGGGPGAEWRPGEVIATLQRLEDEEWVTVATDLDPVIPLAYGKRYGRHRYSALFDPTADQTLGTYRFVVTGAYATAPLTTEPYTLTSDTFEVTAAGSLEIVAVNDGDGNVIGWRVGHPQPDRLHNFRWRAVEPDAWTVTGTLDGEDFAASGQAQSAPFVVPAGSTLIVPPGGISDGLGNTNGTEITITG